MQFVHMWSDKLTQHSLKPWQPVRLYSFEDRAHLLSGLIPAATRSHVLHSRGAQRCRRASCPSSAWPRSRAPLNSGRHLCNASCTPGRLQKALSSLTRMRMSTSRCRDSRSHPWPARGGDTGQDLRRSLPRSAADRREELAREVIFDPPGIRERDAIHDRPDRRDPAVSERVSPSLSGEREALRSVAPRPGGALLSVLLDETTDRRRFFKLEPTAKRSSPRQN